MNKQFGRVITAAEKRRPGHFVMNGRVVRQGLRGGVMQPLLAISRSRVTLAGRLATTLLS